VNAFLLTLKVPYFTTSSAMKKRTDGELHYILKTRMGEKELEQAKRRHQLAVGSENQEHAGEHAQALHA
jgi:hypothetical protein